MPIATTPVKAVIDSAAARLDRLDEQAAAIRLSTLKMCVYLQAGTYEPIRRRCLTACIDAGLLTSPIETIDDDVRNVIFRVLDAILDEVRDGR